jgi:hypothetical protein
MKLTRNKTKYKIKHCPSVTSSDINSIDNMGQKVVRRSEKSDSNCLGHVKNYESTEHTQ